MVFGVNLGEWCKWVTRMYFYVLKGPIFDVKTGKNDLKYWKSGKLQKVVKVNGKAVK